ncbi:pistil-specific extensin-like protein [Pyrus ussuriensis x Pyrus communis]|uniref:Pistil-specific extensin-like protein n=1 Tax=Pyrus ussuriensis x Pyrus communis TaxID=2448454 RepID=A0A5N5IFW5_9ROSA|nr:pistil-specific extensin-like protein [Pyrus ussuriensis x Pyrus communis]
MGSPAVFVQLSVLLLSCFTVFGNVITTLPASPPTHPPAHPPTHGQHHRQPHPHPPTASPVHPPAHSPVHPPAHSPVHPPSPHHHDGHPPVHPPMYPPKKPFPRSFVAVQGVVYCKSCKYSGVDTLNGAKPVLGATVKLQCNNRKFPLVVKETTDKNGYFFITAPKTITTFGAHKCKVSLVSSPSAACSKPSDLHGGLSGALLKPAKPFMSQKLPFLLYNVGPFAFEPTCPR